MSIQTTHYNLTKPELTDTVTPNIFSDNFEIIDETLYALENKVVTDTEVNHSMAIGLHAQANNTNAIAIGESSTTSHDNEIVIGEHHIISIGMVAATVETITIKSGVYPINVSIAVTTSADVPKAVYSYSVVAKDGNTAVSSGETGGISSTYGSISKTTSGLVLKSKAAYRLYVTVSGKNAQVITS